MGNPPGDLSGLFRAIETSLLTEGEKRVPDVRERLAQVTARAVIDDSDDALFAKLVMVVFYSGFRADVVTRKRDVILGHLGDYRRVKDFGAKEIDAVLGDAGMISMRRKVEACVHNAQSVDRLARAHGSFATYLRSLKARRLPEAKEELRAHFEYLGPVTVDHFLMGLGFDVLKPDRVVMRVLHRLGLVDDRKRFERAIEVGREIAVAANVTIRHVDRVLVAYGQVRTPELGIDPGICLEDQPRCEACGVTARCRWYAEHHRPRHA